MAYHNNYTVVIRKFVFVPRDGIGAGVFYTNSKGQFWHFNNISNPNVSMEKVSSYYSYSYGSYRVAVHIGLQNGCLYWVVIQYGHIGLQPITY